MLIFIVLLLARPRLRLEARASSDGSSREADACPKPLTKLLNLGRKYSLWVYQWGLACCAIEMGAAFGSPRYDVMRLGVIPLPASPRQADLVVHLGHRHRQDGPGHPPPLRADARPEVRDLDGLCANCGGPYWDSYSVTKGVDQIIPVDVYVPGCPPRPEALLEGIVLLQERIQNEDMAANGAARCSTSRRLSSTASRTPASADRSRRRPRRADRGERRPPLSDRAAERPPSDGLRERRLVDELRAASSATPSSTLAPASPATTCGSASRTDAWRPTGEAPARPLGFDVLLLPLGHRLAAVAVRQGRGRPDRAAARARRPRSSQGVRRRRDPLPGVRPGHRPRPSRRRHAQGRRPRRRRRRRLVVRRLRRRQLARARDLGDVRHRLRRPPRPAQHLPAGRLRGPPAAQGLPAAGPRW